MHSPVGTAPPCRPKEIDFGRCVAKPQWRFATRCGSDDDFASAGWHAKISDQELAVWQIGEGGVKVVYYLVVCPLGVVMRALRIRSTSTSLTKVDSFWTPTASEAAYSFRSQWKS